MSGALFRRCGCRNAEGKLVGVNCPRLASDDRHGTWGFAVDQPSLDGKRKLLRRSGFATKREAKAALSAVNARTATSVKNDDKETVRDYLTQWLVSKRHDLRPQTAFNYRFHIEKRILPALGSRRLEHLRHEHVVAFVADLEDARTGASTIAAVIAVLRSALGDAVKTKRLAHNAATHASGPSVKRKPREIWNTEQAVTFLDYVSGDPLADLFEVIMGTGLRRGEALALQWVDVDLDRRMLHVRRAVTSVGGHSVLGEPKTTASAGYVGLSGRLVLAFERQRARQGLDRTKWGAGYNDTDLVFAREDGTIHRPEWVLDRFHRLSAQAGLPEVRIHDLRHLAASLMLMNGVPLPLVSKTLRHSQVSITADLYGHLLPEAAMAAADALGGILDLADVELKNERSMRQAASVRSDVRSDRAIRGGTERT